MKSGNTLSAILLTACVLIGSAAATGFAGDLLGPLRERPGDTALLQQLKGGLAGVADADERCSLGVIYCLGVLAYGDAEEGLGVREKMAKAFKSSPEMKELSDDSIFDDCPKCEGGKTKGACGKCAGSKACQLCGGGGKSKAKGFNGAELVCASCRGSGTCAQCSGSGVGGRTCTACFGRGRSLSKDKCREAYLRLLSPNKDGAAAVADTVPAPAKAEGKEDASAQAPAKRAEAVTAPREVLALPPTVATVDPRVEAVYAELVRERQAPQLEKLAAYDKAGWTQISLPAGDKQKMIDIKRQEMLAMSPEDQDMLRALATVRVYRGRPLPYGLKLPSITPPVSGNVDPDIKAVFDENVEKSLANALVRFERRYRTVKEDKLPPEKDKECREEIWTDEFEHIKEGSELLWSDAKMKFQRNLVKKGKEAEEKQRYLDAEKRQQAEQAKRIAEEEAKRKETFEMSQTVREVVERTKAKPSRGGLIHEYALSNEDVSRVKSGEYTTVQTHDAWQELWNRARPNGSDGIRGFFLPFPSGLKYTVNDVKRSKFGNYLVHLRLLEKSGTGFGEEGALPCGTGKAIEEAIYPDLSVRISGLTLLVPGQDKGVAKWGKGDVITSGDWIVPITITASFGSLGFRYIVRSDSEFEDMSAGDGRADTEPIQLYPVMQRPLHIKRSLPPGM